jgi:phage virion morphogenesis protein
MGGFFLTGEWEELKQALARASGVDFRALHLEIGEEILEATSRHFRDEKGPDGPWERSKAAIARSFTKGKKGKKGRKPRPKKRQGKTLTATARLAQSITYRASAEAVDVGTNVRYARIHQYGGETGSRKGRFTLPARPYLYLEGDPEMEREVLDIIAGYVAEALAGGQ